MSNISKTGEHLDEALQIVANNYNQYRDKKNHSEIMKDELTLYSYSENDESAFYKIGTVRMDRLTYEVQFSKNGESAPIITVYSRHARKFISNKEK